MSYHIEGRRWFERHNGNTYHSVTIYRDGAVIAHCPFAYGYGDQYLQTAIELLREAKVDLPKYNGSEPWGGTLYVREALGASYSVVDVGRKKDL